HRTGMAATKIRGTSGAWWKFTWNNKGVQQEALDLLFVAQTPAGTQSYALYVTAPVSKFNQTRPIFDEEGETFATLPAYPRPASTSRWPANAPRRRRAIRSCPRCTPGPT